MTMCNTAWCKIEGPREEYSPTPSFLSLPLAYVPTSTGCKHLELDKVTVQRFYRNTYVTALSLIFDTPSLWLQEVLHPKSVTTRNTVLQHKYHHTPGLPQHSFYSVCHSVWNLIYKKSCEDTEIRSAGVHSFYDKEEKRGHQQKMRCTFHVSFH